MELVPTNSIGIPFHQSSSCSILSDFIRTELSRLNCAIETGRTSPNVLVNRLRPLLAGVRKEVMRSLANVDRNTARRVLQIVGFAVSSIERHAQARGEKAGTGKETLGRLDDLLVCLEEIGKHPPRDSDTTYWYLNSNALLSFTGDSQEAHFNRIVNLQRQVQGNACRWLRPICDGIIEPHSNSSLELMTRAAKQLQELIDGYRSFTEPVNGGYRFSPDFFMNRMRTYLVAYPVDGRLWSGPNAANLAANMSLDYLIGVTAPWYSEIVRNRWDYLVTEEQHDLANDMGRSSITTCVLKSIGLTSDSLISATPRDLARRMAVQPPFKKQMLMTFATLLEPVTHATGIHFRLIHEYLIRNAQKLSDKELSALPVKPTHGTGAMTHERTREIMEMRRKHPVVSKLLAAIKQIDHTHNYKSVA